MIVRNNQAMFFKVRMLSPCFTAYIKDSPYVVLPLLQLRQHHIFYESLAHIERCLAKRIDDGWHINFREYPKIVLRVIQHKRNFLSFGCFFSGSKHRDYFCTIAKACRYPSRLASDLRMQFLIRRQLLRIESPSSSSKSASTGTRSGACVNAATISLWCDAE